MLTTSLPKGVKAREASLKCCFAQGIPMMEIPSRMPNNKCVRVITRPPQKNQRIFMNVVKQPVDCRELVTVLPKGHNARMPSFIV